MIDRFTEKKDKGNQRLTERKIERFKKKKKKE